MMSTLRARWLGRVDYADALELQRALYRSAHNYLLLLEHPAVYTLGARAKLEHLLVDPAEVGADLVEADRGGDITWHGPGAARRVSDHDRSPASEAGGWRTRSPTSDRSNNC